jgi:hypothetical protein
VPGRRVSALGLALLVALAFGAIAASGAQAVDWQHQNGTTVLSGASSETVAGTGKGLSITSKLLGSSVEINCPSATTSGSVVAGGTGTSTIGLEGCVTAKPSTCHLAYQPTLSANVELVQAGGALIQKFTPAGTKFGTILFEGTLCPIAEVPTSLNGSFAGRDPSSELATNHSFGLEPWPEVPLKFGSQPATFRGEVTQHLSGYMANRSWRGIWQTSNGGWEVENGSAFAFAEAANVAGGPVKFSYHLGGAPVSFSCSKIRASDGSNPGARLNPGGTETVKNLTFSGCTVESPSSCTVNYGNEMTFAEVTGTLVRANGKVYERFAPSGFLYFRGAFCPLAETGYAISGSFAGLGPELTVFRRFQPFEFSKAADEAAGASQLTIGGQPTTMAGTMLQEPVSGIPWGAY